MSTRRRLLVALVAAALLGGSSIVVIAANLPQYRTELLVDASAGIPPAGDFGAVAAAVGATAANADDDDSLALRRFGGECTGGANTAELVAAGTGHGEQITRAVRQVVPQGVATVHSGLRAAISDFASRYPLRGRKINRIVLVTRSAADACDADPDAAHRAIQQLLTRAGLRLDIRLVGYRIPTDQQSHLIKLAAATAAPAPAFTQTAAELTTTLAELTVPKTATTDSDPPLSELDPAPSRRPDGGTGPSSQLTGEPDPPAGTAIFPERTVSVGATVMTRGYAVSVTEVDGRTRDGQPVLTVRVSLTNVLWGMRSLAQSSPPELEVHQGGQVYPADGLPERTYARGVAHDGSSYTVRVEPTFQWEDAVLVFPVSRDAQPASIPVLRPWDAVALASAQVFYQKTTLRSGRVQLEFGAYGGRFHRDARMYAEGGNSDAGDGTCDFDRPSPVGLERGKGSLKLYFDLYGDPGAGGFNINERNYTLTLPGGRTIHPDSAASLAVYPESARLRRLAIATQLDSPPTGTFTLTFVDRNGTSPAAAPDSLTFTIG